MVDENPLYDAPSEDQGRESRMADWNKSEIREFLNERYDDPLNDFGFNTYEELMGEVESLNLTYDEDSDWRFNQVQDLGENNFESKETYGLVRKEDVDKINNPEPWEVKFLDEEGNVQISLDNR